MSPLVALLALACAAPLAFLAEGCVTVPRGIRTFDSIVLPSVEIKPGIQYAKIDIANNCAFHIKRVVGVDVTVCDDKDPYVDVPPTFSPVYVERKGDANGIATVYVIQYCEPALPYKHQANA